MCGIAGFVSANSSRKRQTMLSLCTSMAEVLSHRGPNGSGIWIDEESGVALGHRRLAIIDLTESGHQPMISLSGRYIIILNGEIYNFRSLREELENSGSRFRGHSDTEVALSAIEQWGFDEALSRFNGMFALALWDCKDRVLRLARDRIGEKPLYYGWMGNDFIFASELKALRKHPDFNAEVDRQALALYLHYAYIPAPYSIYRGIFKLLPGSVLTLRDFYGDVLPEPIPYWSAKTSAEQGIRSRFKGSESDAVEELDLLLKDAVKIRMESDVPLGIFLSGGIDSSVISALMQTQATNPIRTFTIGFNEKSYNEAARASKIAKYLGTEHTELYINPEDSLSVIPQLPDIYDEPFADSSQIPTFLISKLTRNYVTVALSGDGGDEVFGGYNRYFWGTGIWAKIRLLPYPLRKACAKLLSSVAPNSWDSICNALFYILPNQHRQTNCGHKIHKLAEAIDAVNQQDFFSKLISFWQNPSGIVKGGGEPLVTVMDRRRWLNTPHFSEWMMFMDLVTYLPDDIMAKVDRASMAASLETRAVFLDHRIVEFSFSLLPSMKIRQNTGKILLRKVLNKYLPDQFLNVPKMGFALPLDSWLRGPLKPWAENLLDEKKIKQDGFFDPEPIRKKWRECLSGKRNWQHHIWIILMFQAWKERWQKNG